MRRLWLLTLSAGMIAVALGSTRWGLRAQDSRPEVARPARAVGKGRVTIEDALLQPFAMPFAKETTLADVAAHLHKALDAPVVLDRAALKRLKITPDETVTLELEGVRLSTALQLLLDQVNMTYKVVSQDNLLVLTDIQGADDPSARILSELKTLHREVHDLQDAFDAFTHSLTPVEEAAPALRKPTIIEDMPHEKGKDKPEEPPARSRPG